MPLKQIAQSATDILMQRVDDLKNENERLKNELKKQTKMCDEIKRESKKERDEMKMDFLKGFAALESRLADKKDDREDNFKVEALKKDLEQQRKICKEIKRQGN